MEDSERAVCKLESSFRIRNVGFSVVLTCIFTALYEKCDTTGQMKDIRYVIHVVKMVNSCTRLATKYRNGSDL